MSRGSIKKKDIPDHIPPALVVDVDIYDLPMDHLDPQKSWWAFKGHGPLVYSPYNGGHWVATEGEDVFRFYRDARRFSSAQITLPHPGGDRMLPIQADPPEHGKHRANIQPFFSPSAVAALEGEIVEQTLILVESVRDTGRCEFMSDFALQLPVIVFLKMMGLPLEDRPFLREQVERFLNSPDESTKIAAHLQLHDYLDRLVDSRGRSQGNDAISRIMQFEIDGREYSKQEIISTLTLLLHAGLDTVAMMLGFIAHHLAANASDRNFVRHNPERRHQITQELIRRYSGPNIARILTEDYLYKDVLMKEGDRLLLVPSFFNMDDALEDADEVKFDRSARHITFGSGPHTCAGALLARREIEIFLDIWLEKIPEFRVDPDHPPKFRASQQNSVDELHLIWNV